MSLEVEHAGRLEASSLEIGWLYLLLAPTLLVSENLSCTLRGDVELCNVQRLGRSPGTFVSCHRLDELLVSSIRGCKCSLRSHLGVKLWLKRMQTT